MRHNLSARIYPAACAKIIEENFGCANEAGLIEGVIHGLKKD